MNTTTPLQRSLLTTTPTPSLLEPTIVEAPPKQAQQPQPQPQLPIDKRPAYEQPCFKLVPLEPWMPNDSPITSVMNPVMAADLADLIRYRAPTGTITPHLRALGLQLEAFLHALYSDYSPSNALYKD